MQLLALAAVAALSATVSANVDAVSFNNNATCKDNEPRARIVNRCPYTVYAWSVVSDSQYDCDEGEPAIIEPGGYYAENFRKPSFGGISIKLGKEKKCQHGSITQLEYHLEENSQGGLYNFNSLDVSFVDCQNEDCPARDGYYLKSGNDGDAYATAGDGSICPVLSCNDHESCSQCSYILPDDVQTKTCNNDANLDFYMCGGQAPGEEDSTPAPSSSEEAAPSKTKTKHHDKPSTSEAPAYTAPAYTPEANVAAAAITSAPQGQPKVVKTQVVYETVYVKRHEHAHARRHQHFHA